jgi:hypothetical protein
MSATCTSDRLHTLRLPIFDSYDPLINTDDHAGNMAALGPALAARKLSYGGKCDTAMALGRSLVY